MQVYCDWISRSALVSISTQNCETFSLLMAQQLFPQKGYSSKFILHLNGWNSISRGWRILASTRVNAAGITWAAPGFFLFLHSMEVQVFGFTAEPHPQWYKLCAWNERKSTNAPFWPPNVKPPKQRAEVIKTGAHLFHQRDDWKPCMKYFLCTSTVWITPQHAQILNFPLCNSTGFYKHK